jgi:hypothetical protein
VTLAYYIFCAMCGLNDIVVFHEQTFSKAAASWPQFGRS